MKYSLIFLFFYAFAIQAQLPVIVHENFDRNNYGWFEGENEHYKIHLQNGKYLMATPQGGWISYIVPYLESGKDFSIQATFVQLEGEENHGMGLIWGSDENTQFNDFTFRSNGYFRISCSDITQKISDEIRPFDGINPKGKPNILKVEQMDGELHCYINNKLVLKTKSLPWMGSSIGLVTHGKMRIEVDDFILSHNIKINLPLKYEHYERENLGPYVNSEYAEVSPKISADGKTLYFGRKHSPQNIGGADDREDIWQSHLTGSNVWSNSVNLGEPVNTPITNNLLAVSTDNNTLLFHTTRGFAAMHRSAEGWSHLEDVGVNFKNESSYLEGSLSADGKAIIFSAKLKANVNYRPTVDERDIYVCVKKASGAWSAPIHTGKVINSAGDEYSPFLSADGKTLFFATDGRPGYGDVDIFMAKRLSDNWTQWSEPVNLGLGINTVGFDAYFTIPASGEYAYMVTNVNSYGHSDIIRYKIPKSLRPDPVALISGKVLNAKTGKPLKATIRFEDLRTHIEVGEARSDPRSGDYNIVLPAGKNYGFHAASTGFLSVNENIELLTISHYSEFKKNLYLIPIEVGESIQLKNVFFVVSKPELLPESYPELDRLVEIMKENSTMEIELEGHTDSRGNPDDNLALSQQRVIAVKAYMVTKGISSKRITGKGYGGARPVADSDTEENRQLNRRVEFKITKK